MVLSDFLARMKNFTEDNKFFFDINEDEDLVFLTVSSEKNRKLNKDELSIKISSILEMDVYFNSYELEESPSRCFNSMTWVLSKKLNNKNQFEEVNFDLSDYGQLYSYNKDLNSQKINCKL